MPRPPLARPLLAMLATFAVLVPASAGAQGSDPVLVELGSQKERVSDVFARFDIAVRGLAGAQGMAYDDALFEQVYPFLPQFLEQRSIELVLLEQARARGIVVDEAVIDGVVAQARAQFPDEAAFLEVLAGAGFRDEAQLREVVRETETIQALVAAIEAGIELTELEVRVAYESLRPELVQPGQVCARHILVESAGGAAALARAARAGADFSAMAATASIDRGSAAQGGQLGCFPRGAMVAEFEAAAFAAEVGVATDPVQSQFGYHVIIVDEILPEQVLSLDEVRGPLEEQLRGERVETTIDAFVASSGVRTYPERIPAFEDRPRAQD